jgi:hypothetical protein
VGVDGAGSGAGTRRPTWSSVASCCREWNLSNGSDVTVGESNEPVVGDSDPMGIGTEIAQRMFRPAEWSLGVNEPVITEQQHEPGCEGSRFGERDESAWNSRLPSRKAVLSLATNLPRKTRLSTLMGRKKERREEIQRKWSGASPPDASTQGYGDDAANVDSRYGAR